MEPHLFDIKDGIAIPTEHCYTIAAYKSVIDEFGEGNSGKIFVLCHYLNSLNEKTNPFALLPEAEKEEVIIRQICPELDTDLPVVREAMELTAKTYDTSTHRMYMGIKMMVDKFAAFLKDTQVHGDKDGNVGQILAIAKAYPALREAQKLAYKEYQEEQGIETTRGGARLAYDEDDTDDIET